MKKLLTLICAGSVMMFVITNLITKDYARAYIIHTSSAAEVQKILARLKNTDPSSYRLTVWSSSGTKTITTVYGTASICGIEKLEGRGIRDHKDYAASGILVMQPGSRKQSAELRKEIISVLDKGLTAQSFRRVKLSNLNSLASNY